MSLRHIAVTVAGDIEAEMRAALALLPPRPAVSWPDRWGPEHVVRRAQGDVAVAEPAQGWLVGDDCPVCRGDAWAGIDAQGRPYRCRCAGLGVRIWAHNRASLPLLSGEVPLTLDRLDWHPSADPLRAWARRCVSGWAPCRGGLLILGATGTGKSTFCAAVVTALTLRHATNARWVHWPGLVSAARASNAKGASTTEEALVEPYRECDLLVVDELGGETVTDYSRHLLELVVGYRADAGRTSLLTSNLTPDQLEQRSARVWSRLMSAVEVVTVAGRDRRLR